MASDVDISKFMSYVLRHAPDEAGLTLDDNGWTDLTALCAAVEKRFGVGRKRIEQVVTTSPKKRFSLDGNRIRAAQGHSVKVDLAVAPTAPPATLYHGTKREFRDAILAEGLTAQGRQHVHLSAKIETALVVARRRRGDDLLLKVDAARMHGDGQPFFLADNGVSLANAVAPGYLTEIEDATQS